MAKDRKPSQGRSFRDVNQEYDFLDQGVDGLDAERARRERNRERRARQARNARARRENGSRQAPRPRQEFQDTTVLSQEEIQAQIRQAEQRKMEPRMKNSRTRQRARARRRRQKQRNLLLFGILVLAVLVVLLLRHFLFSGAQEPVVEEREQVAEVMAPEESDLTGKLQKFSRTNKVTNLYKEANDSSEELLVIEKDEYVKHYGVNEAFSKVEYNGEVGYIATIDLSDIEDENMFKVVDGFLIANQEFYLPSDYNPGLDPSLKQAFDIMADAAKKEEIEIKLASDYISYDQQKIIYDQKVNELGKNEADRLVEQPGHSEAQAGLLIELMGSDYEAKTSPAFDQSKEARWLQDNAHKFGFVLRYPQGKEDLTGKAYQSWTYRYVGVEAANQMYENNLALEEFLRVHEASTSNQYRDDQTNENSSGQAEGQGNQSTGQEDQEENRANEQGQPAREDQSQGEGSSEDRNQTNQGSDRSESSDENTDSSNDDQDRSQDDQDRDTGNNSSDNE